MKKWQPWTITDGTLQLTEWPDHGQGVVVVEGDVFAAQEVAVVDLEGDIVCHTLPPGVGSHDTDPWDYGDVLRCLFRHIDAHPQTHYVLRTLHPERVRKCWPAVPEIGVDDWCDGSGPESCPGCGNCCRHRPNVTLSLGPLATQAEADRLVPEMLPLADLCGGLELYSVPTERMDYGRWLLNECPKCGQDADDGPWESRCVSCGSFKTIPPLVPDDANPGYHRANITRIRVDGDRDDNVRFIEQQAIAAGVAFALNWESEEANG